MAKEYRVKVTNEFRSVTDASRRTAGLEVPQTGDGLLVELSDEQLEELQHDQYVTVETKDGKPVFETTTDAPAISTEAENAQRLEQEQAEADKTNESDTEEDQESASEQTTEDAPEQHVADAPTRKSHR